MKVATEPLPAATGLVPKLTVTPEGWPVADSVTDELNPFDGLTVMVDCPLLPAATLRDEGEGDNVKDGCWVEEPVRAAMSPLLGLPHPVTRSNPVTAE